MINKFIRLFWPWVIAAVTIAITAKDLAELPAWALITLGIVLVISFLVYCGWILKLPRQKYLEIVDHFSSNPDAVVFVYGSLLVYDSLRRTLSATDCSPECIPARLKGYRVQWGAPASRPDFLDQAGRPAAPDHHWLSLVAHQTGKPRDYVDGALLGVSKFGLVALRNRETSYILTPVTGDIEITGSKQSLGHQVVAFLPQDMTRAEEDTGAKLAIRKPMFKAINRALRNLGHRGIKSHKEAQLIPAYHAAELVDPIFQSRAGRDAVDEVHRNLLNDKDIPIKTSSRPSAANPLCISPALYDKIGDVAERAVKLSSMCLKILERYPELLEFGGWPSDRLDLLRLSLQRGDVQSPIVRVDLTMSGNRILVLETNADSPAGMPHIDALTKHQSRIGEYDGRLQRLIAGQPSDLTGKVLTMFKDASGQIAGGKPARVAMVENNPKEWPTAIEMVSICKQLKERGLPTFLVDLKDESLRFRNGKLEVLRVEDLDVDGVAPRDLSQPVAVDLVYKRLVFHDLKDSNSIAASALIDAYLAGACKIINPPSAFFSSSKMLMAMMQAQEFKTWIEEVGETLHKADREFITKHLPRTAIWGPTPNSPCWTQEFGSDEVETDKELWVIKSFHGLAGREIALGRELGNSISTNEFEKLYGSGYVVQEYVPHGRTGARVYKPKNVELDWGYHNYILGAYVIDGQCEAIEAKLGADSHVIGMTHGAHRTAVFPIEMVEKIE